MKLLTVALLLVANFYFLASANAREQESGFGNLESFSGRYFANDGSTCYTKYDGKQKYCCFNSPAHYEAHIAAHKYVERGGNASGLQYTGVCPQPQTFVKHGNNGTVSCNTFCGSYRWEGGIGGCVAALNTKTNKRVACNASTGFLDGPELTCKCIR